ncbi:PIG-L deacetylase family protein [Anaerocolumna sp. MB42-C2]|uniref:PIG-L deacetylase family protein n=1 Tax=Anaerocolumna sp. MB42-C2 TaxID=3070997 RepID=UPI0027E1DD58|nr:PIG-L family deacetylase [Anaerocolumna sp. MB42-C2]WMJ86947.1 PIG-L family deacetylase [Anaerocolumna sp. MB42-C2]
MSEEKLTILAVGGHIGDMELTAGMALAKHALEGARIITLALTAGEKGAPAGRDIKEYREQKVREAKTFAQMLGGEAIVFDYPDGELPDNEEVRFKVCDVIRKYKPNILITHYKSSMHKDHNNTHKIVTDARFYASLPGFLREDSPFFAGRFYYAENWEDAVSFTPYLYVDTTEGYELWKKAVATHWFVTGSTSFPYLEYYDHLSRVRGIEARKGRAECFMIPEETYRVIKEGL